MSGTIVNIDTSAAEAMLKSIAGKIARPRGLMSVILGGAKEMTRTHFLRLDAERTQYNSGFYAQWSKDENLRTKVQDNGLRGTLIIVDESGALRHKISGGILRPRTRRFLTIPVSEEAKFATAAKVEAGDVSGLFFAKNKTRGTFFLARMEGTDLVVHYALKTSVTHRPRPEVMPSETALAREAQAACNRFAQNEITRSKK